MTERDNNQLAVDYTTETGVEYLTQNQARSGVAGSPGDEHMLPVGHLAHPAAAELTHTFRDSHSCRGYTPRPVGRQVR